MPYDGPDSGLIGRTVLDATGGSLGPLTTLYADVDTDEIVFGGVTMVRRGRRRTVFVPLTAAVVADHTVKLRCGGQLVRRAPNVQRGHALPADDERGLYTHYDMAYTAPTHGPSRLLPTAP